MSSLLLTATDISHGFEYPLFSNINFTLASQESKAIVGRSGSGKSTLLHILSTFLAPNSGTITLLERDLYSLKEQDIEALRRYDVGIIFQFHYLFKGMSAMANLEVATLLSGEEIDPYLLDVLEIKTLMHQKIGELSGGQQQRISIARVLSKKPRIIFADEPTGNLDKKTASLVMNILLEYIKIQGAGLILVTHDDTIATRCNTTYTLQNNTLKEVQYED